MDTLLSKIQFAARFAAVLTKINLSNWRGEMRDALCNLVTSRTAHFASNLGVVELCLALHTVFDFSQRSADLGHRPPDLSAQADHRAVPAVSHDSHQGRPDGLPEPAGKPVRPVHDRPRRLQRVDRAWA